MSQITLYFDEDAMRHATVLGLRTRNIDVMTAADAAMVNYPDEQHLALAAKLGRTLYTFNIGDYCRLHRTWLSQNRSHAGIILGRQQKLQPGVEVRCLIDLVGSLTAEKMRDRIEFLSSWG